MSTPPRRPPYIFGSLLLLLGLAMAAGGARLLALGGSVYYILAGLTIIASGCLLLRRDPKASSLYGLLLVGTLLWSLYEAGVDLWSLAPRLLALGLIGLWFLTPPLRRSLYAPVAPPPLFKTRERVSVAASVIVVSVTVLALGGFRSPVIASPSRALWSDPAQGVATDPASVDWPHYGATTHGTRYTRADQITPENAPRLEKLWRYRTHRGGAFEATPIQIGDSLYVCTGGNVVVALDAESGERRWEFDPHAKLPPTGAFATTCRGVSYHRAPPDYPGECPERILTATADARLFAVDARTGKRCATFGDDGQVSLLEGMGEAEKGFNFVTSPPTVARGLAIIGGWAVDNVGMNQPSGVVRAFDALTGKFVWAWDMGRPPAGESHTRVTPNVWSLISHDDVLGLLYVPTVDATPHDYGADRSAAAGQYSSSLVALDVASGDVRWSFQTVHHDVWEYDVPSQPALVDLPDAHGGVTPALVYATKHGEIILLDRRTGEPLAQAEGRPAPEGALEGDWTAKTQPFSAGMPEFRGRHSTEADMWGLTPLDQLWCRIEFRRLRHEGHITPPSTTATLQAPGNAGGFDWGSVGVDEDNLLMVVNPLHMGNQVSPLGVPCQKPPYGAIAVMDLMTRQLLWREPLGTAAENGPLGLKLELPMGVPQTAGAVVTKGGVIFVGGTMDRYFRAFDLRTGEELWRDDLPAAAQAAPMSYIAPKSKRQIVVLALPGGDIVAYALPSQKRIADSG